MIVPSSFKDEVLSSFLEFEDPPSLRDNDAFRGRKLKASLRLLAQSSLAASRVS